MGTSGEPAKGLMPYLQRADELQKHEPLVAYYCESATLRPFFLPMPPPVARVLV